MRERERERERRVPEGVVYLHRSIRRGRGCPRVPGCEKGGEVNKCAMWIRKERRRRRHVEVLVGPREERNKREKREREISWVCRVRDYVEMIQFTLYFLGLVKPYPHYGTHPPNLFG